MSFDRDVIKDLKGKAKTEFEGIGGAAGEKAIEETAAAAEAMPVAGKGEPWDENQVD